MIIIYQQKYLSIVDYLPKAYVECAYRPFGHSFEHLFLNYAFCA